MQVSFESLRQFQRALIALSSYYVLMNQYYKSISVDLTITVSNKCLFFGEQVLVIFLTLLVTVATA